MNSFKVEFLNRVGVTMGSSNDIYKIFKVGRKMKFDYSLNKEGLRDIVANLGFKENFLKLEIASGIRPRPGYIHLEYDSNKTDVQVKADARMIPFQDEVFDEVLCIHFLEHLYWNSIPIALSEMNRVLKFGGILLVEVPDFDIAKNRPINQTGYLYDALYMNNRGDGDTPQKDEFEVGFNHMSCFNYDILSQMLSCCGFDSVRFTEMEQNSVHNWIGILAMKATKIHKPYPASVWNDHLGREFILYNKWNNMYMDRYGWENTDDE